MSSPQRQFRATVRVATTFAVAWLLNGVGSPAEAGEITGFTWSSGIASVGLNPIAPPAAPNNDNVAGPSPNVVSVHQKHYVGIGPVDIEFTVVPSGGVTEYAFVEGVDNSTGIPWTDYHIELGFGMGAAFVPSPAGDGLDFDAPDYDSPFSFPPFATVAVTEDGIDAFGGLVPSPAFVSPWVFHVDVPDGITAFTVRQYPTIGAVPEPASIGLMALGACGLAAALPRRRHRADGTRGLMSVRGTMPFAFLGMLLISATFTNRAAAATFGSGPNTFTIDFVPIGNPGNPADPSYTYLPGSVPYVYAISKYEISEGMINKANAAGGLGIATTSRGANKPAADVTWFEAAKFANWLNTSSNYPPAYKFDGSGNFQLWTPSDPGYDANNLFRNSLARYALPSDDEWYKAAYYDASSSVYHTYPLGSSAAPTPVASGTTPGTAVFFQPYAAGPADITLAGGLSPYGTMAQGGNIWEWLETEGDRVNDSTSAGRLTHGGDFYAGTIFALAKGAASPVTPTAQSDNYGFRVICIPEPASAAILFPALALVAGLMRQRIRRKQITDREVCTLTLVAHGMGTA